INSLRAKRLGLSKSSPIHELWRYRENRPKPKKTASLPLRLCPRLDPRFPFLFIVSFQPRFLQI
ncbi:hypothetical protein QQP08_003964, partial [Theobroma cacao]